MKLNKIYIISYLPNDEEKRAKRKELHNRQIEYWKKRIPKEVELWVYAQNYRDEDFIEGVNYIINETDEIKLIGGAKRECLKHFYQTDDDFALILDDDIVYYEGEKYMDSDNIINILRGIDIEFFKDIDVFNGLNPSQEPFGAFYEKKRDTLKNNLYFKLKVNLSGGEIFFKNFKKFYGIEVYLEDLLNEDGSNFGGEDVKLGIELIKKGFGVYSLKNIVRKDMGWSHSLWCKTKEHRKQAMDALKEKIINEWGVNSKNGRVQWSKFIEQHSTKPKEIIIPKNGKKTNTLF